MKTEPNIKKVSAYLIVRKCGHKELLRVTKPAAAALTKSICRECRDNKYYNAYAH